MRNFGLLCPSARIFCLAMGQNQLIMHWYLWNHEPEINLSSLTFC
jgi:hypothetical protein